jgi:hypothetical protein
MAAAEAFFEMRAIIVFVPSTDAAPERIRPPSVAAIDRVAKLNGF